MLRMTPQDEDSFGVANGVIETLFRSWRAALECACRASHPACAALRARLLSPPRREYGFRVVKALDPQRLAN
jgi:hypothetical protein